MVPNLKAFKINLFTNSYSKVFESFHNTLTKYPQESKAFVFVLGPKLPIYWTHIS